MFQGKRHAAVLVLRELAITMPTYFYQQVSPFFELIFNAIQDPKAVVREAAVEALRAALVVTAQRETVRQNQKPTWYVTTVIIMHCFIINNSNLF